MKRNICLLLILALLALTVLCACGEEPVTEKAPAYVFTYRGQALEPDADFAPIKAVLGEPVSYDESPSCAFEGLDKVFGYAGFEVRTYPDRGVDKVYTIRLTDDSVATAEGLRIGDDAAAVDAAYGTEYTASGENRKYAGSNMDLQIMMSGGAVTGISYQHH